VQKEDQRQQLFIPWRACTHKETRLLARFCGGFSLPAGQRSRASGPACDFCLTFKTLTPAPSARQNKRRAPRMKSSRQCRGWRCLGSTPHGWHTPGIAAPQLPTPLVSSIFHPSW